MDEFTPTPSEQAEPQEPYVPAEQGEPWSPKPERKNRTWLIVGIVAGVLLFLACCCCLILVLVLANWEQISQWITG